MARLAAAIVALAVTQAACEFDPRDIASDPEYAEFERFVAHFRGGNGYHTESETIARFNIFKTNLHLAAARDARALSNARPSVARERHGVTKFMDLTPQEFTSQAKGLRPPKNKKWAPKKVHAHAANISSSARSIDWNAKGVLTPIKNQGQCGSCWAFSATQQLESQYFQKYGVLKELAPQQIVSCDTNCNGCGGGNPIDAWGYVSSFGGQDASADYPYTSGLAGQAGTCTAKARDIIEDVGTDYTMIADTTSEEANMLAQIQESPMSICVDATIWQTYTGGVITASSGCGTQIDHAVQATGYNAEGNYWIVRNSWGESWGEKGFVWVEYGSNVCGVTDQAAIVEVEEIGARAIVV